MFSACDTSTSVSFIPVRFEVIASASNTDENDLDKSGISVCLTTLPSVFFTGGLLIKGQLQFTYMLYIRIQLLKVKLSLLLVVINQAGNHK